MISEAHDEQRPQPHRSTTSGIPFANRPLPPEVDGCLPPTRPAIPVFDAVPLPRSARFVVVGAGIHGLSSAYHLAMYLATHQARGKAAMSCSSTSKARVPAPPGLACGCVRNLYMTNPLHAILRASVEVWGVRSRELRLSTGRLRIGG